MPARPKPPLRIGLKYCGGCKPAYDRVALVEAIRSRLGEKVQFLPADSGDLFMILAVQGCSAACADLSPFKGQPVWTITSPQEAEPFIEYIRCLIS